MKDKKITALVKKYLMEQIDVSGKEHYKNGKKIETPHIHIGNDHVNTKVKSLNKRYRKILHKAQEAWYNRNS